MTKANWNQLPTAIYVMFEHLDMLYSYNIYPGQKLKCRINIDTCMLIAVVKYL